MNEKYKKLGKNTLWMTLGNFSSKLLFFFMVPVYTAYLSTNDYGLCDLITTTISLLSPCLTLAASEGVMRFTLDKNSEKNQVFSLAFTIVVGGGLVLCLLTPIVIRNTPLKEYSVLFLIYYFSSTTAMVMQQFVKGLGHVREYAVSGIVSTVVTVVLNVTLLIFLDMEAKGYIYSIILGNVAIILYFCITENVFVYIIKPTKIKIPLIKMYLHYCIPLIPNQISWWINNSSDKFIITYFWGTSVNGIYSVAYKIPSLLNMIASIFYTSWQISAIDEFGSKKSIDFFSNVYRKYHSIFIITASGTILLIKVLAKILFVNEFYQAWKYSVILIIASMLQAMGSFMGTIYTSAMQSSAILITTAISAIVNIILNFMLIPKYGAYGAAIATLISYLIVLILRDYDSKRILPMKINYYRNGTGYFLLGLQAIVVCCNFKGASITSFFIFGVIVFINREIVMNIISIFRKIWRK